VNLRDKKRNGVFFIEIKLTNFGFVIWKIFWLSVFSEHHTAYSCLSIHNLLMEEISEFKTATLTARHPAERRYCHVNFLRAKPARFTSRQKPPFQDAEAELLDAGHDCART
jgi:hypothetical protein